MAVYRGQRRTRPIYLVIAILVLLLLLGIAFVVTRNTLAGDTGASPLNTARAKAASAAQGLDIFAIEYPKELQGQASGARSALTRAQADFTAAQGELVKIDPDTVAQISASFTALNQQLAAKAPADQVIPVAEKARDQLLKLSKP